MKVLQIIAVALFLFASYAHADVINVNGFQANPQEKSNWCWAASVQSIFLTKGINVSQTEIVVAAYGAPVNHTAPGFGGTLGILNGVSVSDGGSVWDVIAGAGGTYPNPNWLYAKLQNNEPVMVWYKDKYTNHSIVINGGEYSKDSFGNVYWTKIFAYDPWLNQSMNIVGVNIPAYIYGTFDIKLKKK